MRLNEHVLEIKIRMLHTACIFFINFTVISFFLEDFFVFTLNNFIIQKDILNDHDVMDINQEVLFLTIPNVVHSYNFIFKITLIITLFFNFPVIYLNLWFFKNIGLIKNEKLRETLEFLKETFLIILYLYTYIYIILPIILEDLYVFENYNNTQQIVFQSDMNIEKIIGLLCFDTIDQLFFLVYIYIYRHIYINIYIYIKRKPYIYLCVGINLCLYGTFFFMLIIFIIISIIIQEAVYVIKTINTGRSRIRTYDGVYR